jgi:hypothetical protein
MDSTSITIEWIRERILKNEYYYSLHADAERMNDDLTIAEVETAIVKGRIIEEYEDSGRGESALAAGFSNTGKPVHAVCGRWNDWMVLITVYIPSPPKFKNVYERGR